MLENVVRTTVDGQEALIDGTVPKDEPIFGSRPTLQEAIDDLRQAFVELDDAKSVHKDATEVLTEAKKAVENRARYVVELSGPPDERQLTLGSDPETIRANLEARAGEIGEGDGND
jgi:hypothetical protein